MADNEIRLNVSAVESEPLNVCVEQVPMNPVNVENTYKGLDYNLLKNKPSIDGVTLEGDKTTAEVIGFDKEYVDEAILTTNAKIDNVEQDLSDRIEAVSSREGYSKEEIDNKVIVIEADIDAQADAIQKTRSDFMESDSELQQQINAHANELTTQKNDIDELGDQVAGIESKIPAGTSDTNPLINRQQLLNEEMDIREDMMESDSELQTQINALADAIQGGGASVPDNVYTQDNLVAGKNIEIEEPAKEIISYSYVPYTLGFGDGPFPELLYSSNKSNPYGTLTYYYLDPELKQYYGYSQTYEASGVLVVTDHSAPPKYLCGVASQVGIPVEVSSGPRKINCVGAYTQTNLLGGKDIEIVPEPVDGGIDEHTLACWHCDEGKIDTVNSLELGSNVKTSTSYYKFGVASAYNNTGYILNLANNLSASSDWTIDFWAKPSSNTVIVLGKGTYSGSYQAFSGANAKIYNNRVNVYRGFSSSSGQEISLSRDSSTFTHYAFQRKSENLELFVNGQKIIQQDVAGVETDGNFGVLLVVNTATCYFDEIRISDTARYTEDFTPPTKAYSLAEPTGNMVVNYTGKAVDLSGKADTDLGNISDNIDYVVESYSDGEGNWYRVYKSGWVEQGGVLTVDSYNYSFPKPFAGIPSLSVTRYSVYLGTAVVSDCTGASGTPTSTGFTLSGVNFKSQYFTGGNWSACGQGA